MQGRDLPYLIIKWLTYTNMQTLLTAVAARYPFLSSAKNLLAGAIAGAVAATVVTPADVCKTRLQAARMDPTQKHLTTLQIGREVVREGGVPALFSGLGPRLMRCAPDAASIGGSPERPCPMLLPIATSLLAPTRFTAPTHRARLSPTWPYISRLLLPPPLAMSSPRTPKQASMQVQIAISHSTILITCRIPLYTAITLATFDLVKDHFAADNLRAIEGALKVEL